MLRKIKQCTGTMNCRFRMALQTTLAMVVISVTAVVLFAG